MRDEIDKHGETIDSTGVFFRDIKESGNQSEIKAISFADGKNKWIYFGLWILHPTKNLIAEETPWAAQAGYYGGFTRINHYHAQPYSRVIEAMSRTYEERVYIRHSDSVIMERSFDPEPDHFNPITKIENLLRYRGLIRNSEADPTAFAEMIKPRYMGLIVDPVFKITDKQRKAFIDLWEYLPSDLVVFKNSTHKISKHYKENYYRRLIESERAWEEEQERRKIEGERPLEEWEPAPVNKSLYLMKDDHTGCYKIGVSTKPEHREATLAAQKPSVKLVGQWEGLSDNEKLWHGYFADHRVRGEWFKLTKAQVSFMVHHCLKNQGPPLVECAAS